MTHFRYEILRTLRNRVFYAISLALPLVLYYSIASGQRHGTFDGTAFPLYFMTSMAVYGAMYAVVAPGARIARDRSLGWLRQLQINEPFLDGSQRHFAPWSLCLYLRCTGWSISEHRCQFGDCLMLE